jgi:hypothetical protein
MKRVIGLIFIGLVTMSFAWAKPLDFEDGNFDYSDDGLETAYVSLAKNDTGGLDIVFSSEETPEAVATVDVEDQVAGYDTADDSAFWEARTYVVNAENANTFDSVDLDYRGLGFQRVTLVHESQNFQIVREAYLSQLEQLGFALEPERLDSNTEVYTLQSGEDTVRVIMNDRGSDTQVTFSVS